MNKITQNWKLVTHKLENIERYWESKEPRNLHRDIWPFFPEIFNLELPGRKRLRREMNFRRAGPPRREI